MGYDIIYIYIYIYIYIFVIVGTSVSYSTTGPLGVISLCGPGDK
jgi:hypothetical protein